MDEKTLEKLELPIILKNLEAYASFSASKALARQLRPTSDLQLAVRMQQETTQARQLLAEHPNTTIGGARDVRPSIERGLRGAVLDPSELLDIHATLQSSKRLQKFFSGDGSMYTELAGYGRRLDPLPEIIDRISRAIGDQGEVLDDASEALRKIRREKLSAHDRLTSRLEKMVADPKVVPMLQEPIITQRDGRFVIPLRVEFKGQIKGVVHDLSASGATLFVEPLPVVELNNQVRELELEERDEIQRILGELTLEVVGHAVVIQENVETLAELDLIFARAQYANTLGATEPRLHSFESTQGVPGSILQIRAARHPLLDPEIVVPEDLILDDDSFALVITGPNTGGKTVVLKTAGLLALMAACGLHIPAESGSELSLFESVFADIGDEQSIEQSLSTFSGHISNVIRILHEADQRSLVLLDELGAGTDPQEGSALARSLLEEFLDRGITTLIATHFPELKIFAHATPGVRNASVEFDLESLQPTYRLTIGLPGRSNALAIATRLGLDQSIVERARSWVSPEELKADDLLDEIYQQRDLAVQGYEAAEAARSRAERAESELEKRIDEIDQERSQILEEARQAAELETQQVREDLDRIRRRISVTGQPKETIDEISQDLEAVEARVGERKKRHKQETQERFESFSVGEEVFLSTIQSYGVITSIDDSQVEVQVGRLRVRAQLDEISRKKPAGDMQDKPDRSSLEPSGVRPTVPPPPLELDLRGRTADEAVELLERRLDSAYLNGMPYMRVIHGKGSGRLREAIRKYLESNEYVEAFEPGGRAEGGDGVTVVRIKQ